MDDDQPVKGHTFAWALFPDGTEVVTELPYTEALEALEDNERPGEASS